MDFNGSKLGDIKEIIEGYQNHRLTLINGYKATQKDIEYFILNLIRNDNYKYTYTTDGTILELDEKED